jgi:hypothetical protein
MQVCVADTRFACFRRRLAQLVVLRRRDRLLSDTQPMVHINAASVITRLDRAYAFAADLDRETSLLL